MPRARRRKATRSRSRGRSLLMGGTGRRRGVSKRRSTRRKTGRGLLPGFMKDMIYAFAPAGLPGMGRRRRYSRRTRGGAMKKPSHAAPAAQAAAAAHVAAKTPAKSGSRVKTALKGLAGLATALGAAYLGNKAYQIKNRQDVNLSQIGQRAQLPKSPYSYGYQFDMRNSNV